VLAIADEGLSTPEVYAELDAIRGGGDAERIASADDLINALRTHDPAQLGRLLANDLGPAALRLRPSLGKVLQAGLDLGALGGVISGSGPTCAFLTRSHDRAVRFAASLSGVGVCRTVRVAHGPVPGARIVGEGG
jgi:4-diphosphocytidyl-2-C-methyl-D-erythritol kinase